LAAACALRHGGRSTNPRVGNLAGKPKLSAPNGALLQRSAAEAMLIRQLPATCWIDRSGAKINNRDDGRISKL